MMSFKGKLLLECQHRVSPKHFLNMILNNLFFLYNFIVGGILASDKSGRKVAETPREQHRAF